MRAISLFVMTSLDGYVYGPGGDLSWARNDGEAFSPERSESTDAILLGRRTYEMMASSWPTPEAREQSPEIAEFMNDRRKLVASHEPFEPDWENTTVVSGDIPAEVAKLKEQPGGSIIVLGSNELCVSLVPAGLVDVFQVLVHPVVLGDGTSLFAGLLEPVYLTRTGSREFGDGTVLLTYEPAADDEAAGERA